MRVRLQWQDVERAVYELGQTLLDTVPDIREYTIVPVMRGGMIPATLLSHTFDLSVSGYVLVRSYSDGGIPQPKENIIEHSVPARITKPLFVDDIIDTGKTIQRIKEMWHYENAIYAAPTGKVQGITLLEGSIIKPPLVFKQDVWVIFPWEAGFN